VYASVECVYCENETVFNVENTFGIYGNEKNIVLRPDDITIGDQQRKEDFVCTAKEAVCKMIVDDEISKDLLLERVKRKLNVTTNLALDIIETVKVELGGWETKDNMIVFA